MQIRDEEFDDEGKKARRRAFLMQYLEQNRYISVEEIASRFSVTTQTARRDIVALELEGKVRRLHGGAVASTPIDPTIYRQRRIANASAKEAIGGAIARLVPDNASVFIDTGTTCEAVARALIDHKGLRVVTYSLRVAATLSECTDFTIAVPGGFVRQVDGGVFSQSSAEFIQAFKFDFVIISVSGIDEDGDIGDDDYAEVTAVRAAMLQAGQVILALDSSKFGRRGLVRLGSLSDVDLLVTETAPTGDLAAVAEKSGVTLHLARLPSA
ncbi:DeoR/GlpR transcriptional regulator [Ancylobacter dichloromethanicus]|uniref:Glycerol-3-phosphate regulon repressor n=1 Tax=Ancylobacter dichloromethanicus TaxID=518825 RepID=A0A9W6JA44_9HYPH|nr:DeoR/GlpR family DNA-binding transcription regulator [Ancylobacter dichloromethanicus]MBS7556651.1 DeoR/GlpR transcriptional regulator [Ancylobacter dichloromethanicus]GLK73502.1 glycerol-3-phosphate regulon repressor [Ancylobacter dichloromethanicus]